ncbi:MAG TPA: FkbM family methyltransferase [Lacunisphaera sp.]|nr:FkbM family methyltransferase [Lacunisphaera sp.]
MKNYLKTIQRYYSLLGLKGVAVFLYSKVTGRLVMVQKSVAGLKHPIHLRIGTTDPAVYRQVLVEQQYDVGIQPAPQSIIDAGANIGLSAVFFANRYPAARIVAIEPMDENFAMLKKNIAPYPQITAFKGALWKETGRICLFDSGEGHHGFQTRAAETGAPEQAGMVQATTVDALMKEMKLTELGLLKIDIEGSEKEVFENSASWIGSVQAIMAELHDHLKPGCSSAFAAATQAFPHEYIKGETVIRSRRPKP